MHPQSHLLAPPQCVEESPAAVIPFPPILSPTLAAAFCDRTPGALYHWASNSKLHGVSRLRGKHRLIWRDRLLAIHHGTRFRVAADGSIRLTEAEINKAFNDPETIKSFPPLMSVKTLARLVGAGRSSIFRWIALGHLAGTYLQRSDGIRFMRTPVLLELFNGASWNDHH
jgi:hypothetical protein